MSKNKLYIPKMSFDQVTVYKENDQIVRAFWEWNHEIKKRIEWYSKYPRFITEGKNHERMIKEQLLDALTLYQW